MARTVAFVVSALCVLALATFAHSSDPKDPEFFVTGRVYCDTCRVQFITRVSEPIPRARVAVECRNRENGTVTHNAMGVTNEQGDYKLPVKGDYEEDICEVRIFESPRSDCSQSMVGLDRARIALTGKNGVLNSDRYANPLGFMKTDPLPECTEVLDEIGFFPIPSF